MEKRQAIAALLDVGCPAKAVASNLKVGLTLVYKVKNLVKAGADLQPQPGGGRKRTARCGSRDSSSSEDRTKQVPPPRGTGGWNEPCYGAEGRPDGGWDVSEAS